MSKWVKPVDKPDVRYIEACGLVTGKNVFCKSLCQRIMYTFKTAQLFLSGKKNDTRSQENRKVLSGPKRILGI